MIYNFSLSSFMGFKDMIREILETFSVNPFSKDAWSIWYEEWTPLHAVPSGTVFLICVVHGIGAQIIKLR